MGILDAFDFVVNAVSTGDSTVKAITEWDISPEDFVFDASQALSAGSS